MDPSDGDRPRDGAGGPPERLSRVFGIVPSVRTRPLVALPLVALVLASLALPVSGQLGSCSASETELTFDITAIDGNQHEVPIPPGTTESFDVEMTYSWPAGGYSVDPVEIARDGSSPLTFGGPSWIETTFNRSAPIYVDVPQAPGPAGSVTVPLTLNVTMTEEAPSFVLDFVWIEAIAEDNCDDGRGNLEEDGFSQTWRFSAGALPQVRVTPSQKLVQLGTVDEDGHRSLDGRVVPVEVANTGNVDVQTELSVLEVPDRLDVQIEPGVEVPVEGTRNVNMTLKASGILDSMRGEFILEARPHWSDDAETVGPTTRTTVVVSVQDLPSALLFGQQNIAEVLVFTGLVVVGAFAAGWPMTTWWERRRKAAGRGPIGSGSSGRSATSRDDDGDDGDDGSTVHGVPKEGDDYEIVEEDRDVFSKRKVHGVPREGPDYEVVEEDDLFDS